ncbi:TolC family protein [Anabaena azotica]|uniref:TolC family protein n=1 Tax=Anabaena azotica FACHB-119 TaxID=947527 RepID=A0ABR8D5K9_9NOST|nr:TolC family protein [Anabaena azotica]MBD2502443.1 TolC family protein [Anabaena azotica FACHB-119]
MLTKSVNRYIIIVGMNFAIASGNITSASAQIPNNLQPNSNPLNLPTSPAQVTVQQTQSLTLQQSLELARRRNTELQAVLLQIERSRAALREVEASQYPSISLNIELTRSRSVSIPSASQQTQQFESGLSQTNTVNQPESVTTFNSNLELTYGLYNYGQGLNSRRAAEEQVRLDELETELTSAEVRLNVTLDYYNLQQADENVRIRQSAVSNAQASLRDAEALERAAVGTRYDLLRSQVNLANAQQELINAISSQRTAQIQLATRLNLPETISVRAADPVRLNGLWNRTREESIILALQNRPELRQNLTQRNIAELRRRIALSQLKPEISLVTRYNLLDRFDDTVSVTDGYVVGVQGTATLFDGGVARAQAAQQAVQANIAEAQFANQLNNIQLEVEQAYFQLQSNLENVNTANIALEQAREALRYARLSFQAGVGNQTNVINSENDLTQAEGNRVQAIVEYNRALARLQRAANLE